MALDIVLKGVSNIQPAAMLASLYSESIAKMVHSAIDSGNKIGGANTWTTAEVHSIEHQAGIDAFSKSRFELPPQTLAAGDKVTATLAPVASEQQPKPEEAPAENDPFAASDAINKPQELVGGFKKTKHGKRNERRRESRAVIRCQTQLIKQA